jgi:hypothetical protein
VLTGARGFQQAKEDECLHKVALIADVKNGDE